MSHHAGQGASPDRTHRILGAIGLTLVIAVVGIAIIGPLIPGLSSFAFVGRSFTAPSRHSLLGTDVLGRDVFARLLNGGATVLILAGLATLLGVASGALLGLLAGYFGRWADEAIMRLLDVLLAFPQIILALLFVSILGPRPWLIILVVAAIHTPQVARVTRAATRRVRQEDYIHFAEMLGTSRRTLFLSEVLPNIATPILVELGLRLTYSVSLIAGMSFLGVGIQPPTPDWGVMINENRIGVVTNPWGVVAPVLLLALLTIGINLVMDAWLHRVSRQAPGDAAILQADPHALAELPVV